MKYLLFTLFFTFSLHSHAVNLSKRFSIGAGSRGLSVKYFPNSKIALSSFIFFHNSTFKKEGKKEIINNYSAWIKVDYIFFSENYMNFYYSLASNYKGQAVDVQALLGGELFFEWWPNLSFIFDVGLSFISYSDHFQIRTVSNLPFSAGLYYYF